MTKDSITGGPNFIHPEKSSAVGSRNSLNRSGRDEYLESKIVVDEAVDKILNHVQSKLPPEVLERLDVMGGIKSKIHNYYNQTTQNMLNRYLVTVEDELGKKYRDLVDKEEHRLLNHYTPRGISELLEQIGGADQFNTGETEKALVNIYGHLQGHIQRGLFEIEGDTNALLRQKTDIGAFVRGDNAYAIAKCSFKNNMFKPRSVVDVKLAINVLESELISPISHYQVPIKELIQNSLSDYIHQLLDKEVVELNRTLLHEGKEELSSGEIIFEKFKSLEKYSDNDPDNEDSQRYTYVAKKIMDAVDALTLEAGATEKDPLNIRDNIQKIIEKDNISNRGFNTAINSLTSILDTSKMGYQHIDNFKNSRVCAIREYESRDLEELPDERYAIKLTYYDQEQLEEEKQAYDKQMSEFNHEIEHAQQVIEALYDQYKATNSKRDFDDIADEYLNKKEEPKKGFFDFANEEDGEEEKLDKLWNELVFIAPEDTVVEKLNKTNRYFCAEMKERLNFMRERIAIIFKNQNPPNRLIADERIEFLESKFQEFISQVNPYHLQPGVVVELDITSVKRKKTTLTAMSNVLNEFLHSISKGANSGFSEGFSRRRSTVREDIEEEFSQIPAMSRANEEKENTPLELNLEV